MTQEITRQLLKQAMLPGRVVRELPADLETPISIYLKLRGSGPSFLLESVTGGEQVARFSFIGVQARRAYVFCNNQVRVHNFRSDEGLPDIKTFPVGSDPFEILRSAQRSHPIDRQPGLPRLTGGLVGYLGYEMARYFEPSIGLNAVKDVPEAIFLQTDTIIAFDHAYGKVILIATPPCDDIFFDPGEIEHTLDDLERRIKSDLPQPEGNSAGAALAGLDSNFSRAEFVQKVRTAKEHIAAGDIFQLVLSQCFERQTSAKPFEIYRALRRLNPSPYMFFFDFDGLVGSEPFHVLGASPEMHARLEGGVASLRPIAGTRRRGQTAEEDAALEADLLADPKERAEHVMLVDLGRNDLGRLCEYGSVRVTEQMRIERYSHVMHIVSHVEGRLRPGLDAFDLLRATFPAGTVSGAPKIRAMQLIRELEPSGRNIYAGLVGYFAYDGDMDTCIAIRTLEMHGQRVRIQAGAGIVADSNPESEYEETVNKARALAAAVTAAEQEGERQKR